MAESCSPHEALTQAINIAGSQSALARIVGCTPGAIWLLVKNGKPLSAKFVLKAEEATGVSRYLLCPDVYGPEPTDSPAHATSASGMEPAR